MKRVSWWRRILYIVGGLILVGIIVIGSWMMMNMTLEWTGAAPFCTSCHVMEPMGKAHAENVHGGNNPYGIHAQCTDCHLPHGNPVKELTTKTWLGIRDVAVNFFGDPESIDWEARRHERESFVYDSACLRCHMTLEDATISNPRAFLPHRAYFMGETKVKCVRCHPHVGHTNLGLYLREAKQEWEQAKAK